MTDLLSAACSRVCSLQGFLIGVDGLREPRRPALPLAETKERVAEIVLRHCPVEGGETFRGLNSSRRRRRSIDDCVARLSPNSWPWR